ncbi:F-actin-capping protein subunit alpha-like [Centruroides sculpturatus]|uniref:F-actin-capping protein subunit alpha-like n=1 Tax=Centruroides sculpturatus TaxID=218467 RepID=UPI000C6E4153|nr:F-actin-capping protein subunit alpha-like [Centruroides sculpturatus]
MARLYGLKHGTILHASGEVQIQQGMCDVIGQALITEFNALSGGRFYDPRSQQSFKYDHLRKEATDFQPWEPDQVSEPWRLALQDAWIRYMQDHYRQGVCSVFGNSDGNNITLIACIEDHQFQPKNYWYDKIVIMLNNFDNLICFYKTIM